MYESIDEVRLRELLTNGSQDELSTYLQDRKPADIADVIEHLNTDQMTTILHALSANLRAETFTFLDRDLQLRLARRMDGPDLTAIIQNAPTDEASRILLQLGRRKRQAVLARLARDEREAIKKLEAYDRQSAGGNVSSRYANLRPDMKSNDAVARLRAECGEVETIYVAFVVDDSHRLLGVVELADLLVAPPKAVVKDLMDREFVSAFVDEDREVAANRAKKYDLLSLPVLTREGKMVGIITHDEALDILEMEQREDADRFVALMTNKSDVPYLRLSVIDHFRRRIGWVLGLAAVGLISGYILHVYEDVIAALVILALYIPTIADTGGNTGTQASSLIVRALAVGDVRVRDTGRIVAKEFAVAMLLAGVLFLFALFKVFFLSNEGDVPAGFSLFNIGLAVGLAIAIQVLVSTILGAALPLGAKLVRQDPAVVAGPALTTLVDITGLSIYFTVCTIVLGLD